MFHLVFLAGALCGLNDGETNSPPPALAVDGSRFSGQLVSIDRDWQLRLSAAGAAPREVSANGLVFWGRLPAPERGEFVLLSDGSFLAADVIEIGERIVTLENDVWGEMSVPRQLVRGMVWQLPVRPLEQTRLIDRVRSGAVDEDELVLQNGDVIRGRLESVDGRSARFAAAAPLQLDLDHIVAWIQEKDTNQDTSTPASEGGAAELPVLIGLRDGSLVVARSAELGESLVIELRAGIRLASQPVVRPVDENLIVFVQPLQGAIAYLSDLSPLSYKHIPFLSIPWTWRADRNVMGGPLQVRDERYAKGLGMHSTSRLAYELPGTYHRFDAAIAIDDSAGQGGSVVFRVFTERQDRKWREAYKSPVVRGGDEPRSISVDISGAGRIALVVDFADRGDQLDYANWLNARLVGGK